MALPNPLDLTSGDLAPAYDPVARLNKALGELKAQAAHSALVQTCQLLREERHVEATPLALKAAEIESRNPMAWHLLALCREKAGEFDDALACYEAALGLAPDDPDLANDIGRLAYQMGRFEVAEQLFRLVVAMKPDYADGRNNLACALRDQLLHEEAIEILRAGLEREPDNALQWNTLGTILAEQGDAERAAVFFTEALRLNPAFAMARYNMANARLALGQLDLALEDCDAALEMQASTRDKAQMRFARALVLLAQGDLAQGWPAYASRLDGDHPDATYYVIDRPGWTAQSDLAGRTLLLIGEQGLGDEVLFANAVPDVLEALGPDGKLWLVVEPRLVPLLQRSFPRAHVVPHLTRKANHRAVRSIPDLTDPSEVDLWAPMGCMLERFRSSVAAYPDSRAFLVPDPARVAHWRAVLDGALPGRRRVGLVWKSLKINSARSRYYSPFDAWAPILRTPGVAFVNLQYGECAAELARAREVFGVEVWNPPGIDLKQDLDDVAALCQALDLAIGPANATTNLAAAVGTPTWLISPPYLWSLLGTDRFPWYPSVRLFQQPAFGQWGPVMAETAGALAAL